MIVKGLRRLYPTCTHVYVQFMLVTIHKTVYQKFLGANYGTEGVPHKNYLACRAAESGRKKSSYFTYKASLPHGVGLMLRAHWSEQLMLLPHLRLSEYSWIHSSTLMPIYD